MFLDRFLQISLLSIATKIRPVGDALKHAAMQMDRHDEESQRLPTEHDTCKRLHE